MARPVRSSALPLPRFIKPEMILIGDTIRVTYGQGVDGIERTRVGRVAKREYMGQERQIYTAQGGELLVWVPGQASPTVTLLDRQDQPQETLF